MALYRNGGGDSAFVVDGTYRFTRRANDQGEITQSYTGNGTHIVTNGILLDANKWFSSWRTSQTTSYYNFTCTKSKIRVRAYALLGADNSKMQENKISFSGCTTKIIAQNEISDTNSVPYIDAELSDITTTITCNVLSCTMCGLLILAQAL